MAFSIDLWCEVWVNFVKLVLPLVEIVDHLFEGKVSCLPLDVLVFSLVFAEFFGKVVGKILHSLVLVENRTSFVYMEFVDEAACDPADRVSVGHNRMLDPT